MANIILPRRFTQQPTGPCELSSTGLGEKCLFAYHPGVGLSPIYVHGKPPRSGVYTGTAPTGVGVKYLGSPTGQVLEFHPAGGPYGIAGINTGVSSGADVTMFWAGYPLTSDVSNLSVLNRGSGTDSMRINAGGVCAYIDSSPAQIDCNVTQPITVGRFEQIAFTKTGARLKSYAWRSGNTATVTGGNANFRNDSSGNYFYINHKDNAPNGHNNLQIVAAFNALNDAEVAELFANPWQIFRAKPRVLYFDVANGGGVTGTISATWENFTSSITGTTTVVGAISQTLSNFTSSIDGYPVTTGTIAQTLENYTSTISGSPIDSGTISQTLEDYTSNISGSIGSAVSGTIAVTLENFTQSAQGTTTVIGNMAVNLNDFTSAITGTTTVIGTSNISLDPFIMTANGYPGDVVLIRIRTLVGAGE